MPKKADANQPAIVKAIRKMGASVQHLHTVGQGCPDIMIGLNGYNYLAELKDGDKPPSARKLTSDERDWHRQWRGQVVTIENEQQAVDFVRSIRESGL